jgi:hypothetical protein
LARWDSLEEIVAARPAVSSLPVHDDTNIQLEHPVPLISK